MANAVQDKLEDFVRDSFRSGKSRADIEKALEAAEWTADQIRGALRAYADVECPIPVPRPRPQLSSRVSSTQWPFSSEIQPMVRP
jgi:hypothetical protein